MTNKSEEGEGEEEEEKDEERKRDDDDNDDNDRGGGTGGEGREKRESSTWRGVRLVERAEKGGLASAYKAGVEVARGTWVVLMDADGSHHPRVTNTPFRTLNLTH